MASTKQITILVDNASWPQGKPPVEVTRLNGVTGINLEASLLHTALWTRAPRVLGCDLSDAWAWLRYGRAFAGTHDLRMRREWEDISSQQKAVLSEEIGVGVATQVLAEQLGFLLFVETKALVHLLGTRLLKLGRTTKRGPKKAPDYLALDHKLEFSALECKGNQSSLKELQRAIKLGIEQKQNLNPGNGSRLKHSLVSGLFIPQARSKETATLQISDPTWEEMLPLFTEIPFRELVVCVTQLALAKHFALLGCQALANALATADLFDQRDALARARGTLPFPVRRKQGLLSCEIEFPQPKTGNPVATSQESLFPDVLAQTDRVAFTATCPLELYDRLTRSKTPAEEVFQIANQLENQRWQTEADEFTTQLVAPFGFRLALQYR